VVSGNLKQVLIGCGIWASCVCPAAMATDLMALQLYNQGVEASSVGNSIMAARLFERATRLDPTFADAHYNLGVCYYDLRQYDKSAQAFKQVLTRYPNDPNTRQSYQRALAMAGGPTQQPAFKPLPASSTIYGQKQATIIHLNQWDKPQSVVHATPKAPAKTATYVKPRLTKSQPVLVYQAPASAVAASAVYGNTTIRLKPYTKPAAQHTSSAGVPGSRTVMSYGHKGPTGIGQGPDASSVYVANYLSNSLYKVNATTGKSLVTTQGLSGPIGLVWNPTRQEWYVANYKGNSVTRIKPDGKASVVSSTVRKPYMLLLDEPRQTLYVTEQETNTVSKIKL
jgi:Tetratricopeptide repeat